jgi:ABC-2 type transport system ATP-binding protein
MVKFEAVTFGYGKRPLFEGLDLVAEPGSTIGLLGLNGAGKTSLLKLAAGALFPAAGRIEVFGRESRMRAAALLADVAFVSEDPWAPPLSAEAWLGRYGVFRPAFDRDLFFKLLEEFQVERSKNVAKLSYGQRKKFAVSAAMASGARAVLLDEPTNGLDIPAKAQFRRALALAATEEKVFIVSTHQARDLENLLDPVVVVHEGKILCSVPASTLAERFSAARLDSIEGRDVVYAERDALGWTALLAEAGNGADLELAFTAAIRESDRFRAVLAGSSLPGPYRPSTEKEGE